MMIQACLNGGRSPRYHPRLPVTPERLAQDGAACVLVGASELHVHPRDFAGQETLDATALGLTVSALRRACPQTPLGVSTGAWIEGTADQTLAAITSWRELPDYASVNLSEDGAPSIMKALWHRGIGVEAELASVADAERLLNLHPQRVLRVLIEIEEQDEAAAIDAADRIDAVLSAGEFQGPRLLHGFDQSVWPLVDDAFRRGFSTRVGLEDGDRLPDGMTTSSNETLVKVAAERRKMLRPTRG